MEDENENKIENIKENEIKNEDSTEKIKILSILMDIFNNNDSKEKKISISKENYELILNFINKANNDNLILFFDYLNDFNMPVLQVLIDGYIKIDFDKDKNKLILQHLERLFKIYFNKKIFKLVYKQLSKLFRKNYLLKELNTIKKFEKIMNVWKLLYNIDNNQIQEIIRDGSKSQDLEIYIKNKEFFGEENTFIIDVYFNSSEILKKMKLDKDFYFIKIYDDNKIKLTFSYLKFFELHSAEVFQKTNKMTFTISKNEFSFLINNIPIKSGETKNLPFNFNNITKIKFLNYFFYAEIFQINIKIKNVNISNSVDFGVIEKQLEGYIKKGNYSDKYISNLELKCDDQINGITKKINFDHYIKFANIKFGNNRDWIKRIKRLGNIRYYGGIESFIPLIKIIKYIMDYLGNNDSKSNQEICDYLNKSINWIKDIIKIILRLISLSEKNYINFQKCIIPLIGAFAEISSILNKLLKSNIISQEQKNALFKDEIIYSLFIAIIYARFNTNIIEMYKKIFEMEEKWNIKFSMDYLFYDFNNIKDSKFYWYFGVLFSYALFILLYNDSPENCPKSIIDITNNIKSDKNSNKNQFILNFFLSINPFINLINELYSNINSENYKFEYSYEYCKSNGNFLKLLISLMKTVLNVKFLSKINKINFNKDNNNNIIMKLILLLSNNKITIPKEDEEYKEIVKNFYNYGEDVLQLEEWINLKSGNLKSYKELLANELIDYNGKYHKVMKELFLFNRFWSKEKLFTDGFNKKLTKVKYKVVNYYTRNFQRPIIYPVLDYKYRYPEFSSFKINNDFYKTNADKKNIINIKKIEDDYNFNLFCPEFEEFVKNYNMQIYNNIKKNTKYYIDFQYLPYKAIISCQRYFIFYFSRK